MLVKPPKNTESKSAWRFLQFFGLESSRESASAKANNRPTKEPEERKHQFATWYIFAAFLGVMLIQYLWLQYTQIETIPYSQFEELVDQNKIGLGITVFVSVESADHSEAWLRKFADAVSAMPEVMEFYRMAGDVDYMLRVVVADMQSYDVFYKRLIGAVPLKNVTSRFAMEKIKSVTALPIPAMS